MDPSSIITLLQDKLEHLTHLCESLGRKVTRPVAGRAMPDASSLVSWRELAHCSERILQCQYDLSLLDPVQVVIKYDSIHLNIKKIGDSVRLLCEVYSIPFPEPQVTDSRQDLFRLIDTIASDVDLRVDARQLCGKGAVQFVKHLHTRLSCRNTHHEDCSRVLSLLQDLRWRTSDELVLYEEEFDALLKQCKAIPGPQIIEPLEGLHDEIVDYKKHCSRYTFVKIIVEDLAILRQLQDYQESVQQIYRQCGLKAPDRIAFTTDLDTISVLIREVTLIAELRVEAIQLRGNDARLFMDRVQESLDRERQADVLKLLQDLSDESDELPPHMLLDGVEQIETSPSFVGGEAHIFMCRFNGRAVVSRRVKLPQGPQRQPKTLLKLLDIRKEIRREILVHRQLKHNNIISLLGVVSDTAHPLGAITPFMENGDSVHYLEHHPTRLLPIILGAASAVSYLHGLDPPVIHGDIRGSNILVDSDGVAKLCDFGFARFRREVSRTHTRHVEGGSDRHIAPELFCGDYDFRTTPQTDIYSLSMTLLELSTHSRPFQEFAYHGAAAMAAVRGQRPCRPTIFHLSLEAADELWSLIKDMWDQTPSNRPPAHTVVRRIEKLQEIMKTSASSIAWPIGRCSMVSIDEERTMRSPCAPRTELPVITQAFNITDSPKPLTVDSPLNLSKTFPKEMPNPSVGEALTMHPVDVPMRHANPVSGEDDDGQTSPPRSGRSASAGSPEDHGGDDASAPTRRSPTGDINQSTPSLPSIERSRGYIESPRGSPLGVSPSRHSEFEGFPASVSTSQAQTDAESRKRELSPPEHRNASDSPRPDMDSALSKQESPSKSVRHALATGPGRYSGRADSEPTCQQSAGEVIRANPISSSGLEPSHGRNESQSGSPLRIAASHRSEFGSSPSTLPPPRVQVDVLSQAPRSLSGQGQVITGLGLYTAAYKRTPPLEIKALHSPLIAGSDPQDEKENGLVFRRGSSSDTLPPESILAADLHSGSRASSEISLPLAIGSDSPEPIAAPTTILLPQIGVSAMPQRSVSGLVPATTGPDPIPILYQLDVPISVATSPPPEMEDIHVPRNDMGSQNTPIQASISVQSPEPYLTIEQPPTQLAGGSAEVLITKIAPGLISPPAGPADRRPSLTHYHRTPFATIPMMSSFRRTADQLRADTMTPALSVGSDTEAPSGTEDEAICFARVPYKRSPLSPGPNNLGMLKAIVVNPPSIADADDAFNSNMDEPSIGDNVGSFE